MTAELRELKRNRLLEQEKAGGLYQGLDNPYTYDLSRDRWHETDE